MLKTITAFRIGDKLTKKNLNHLHDVITEATIVDPGKTQWSAIGYSHPEHFGSMPIFVAADGTVVFNIQVRERVLPGPVIRKRVAEIATDHATREGHKPSRKRMAEIKERVVAELLPTSHIKAVDVRCIVTKDYLLLGTSSARLVDLVLETLIGTFETGPLILTPVNRNYAVDRFLADLIIHDSTISGHFNCGRSAVLKQDKAVARFKGIDLASDAVKDRIAAGMRPTELAIEIAETLTFTLTDQGVLKGINVEKAVMSDGESYDDAIAAFEGSVFIFARLMRNLLDNLYDEVPSIKAKKEDDEDEL